MGKFLHRHSAPIFFILYALIVYTLGGLPAALISVICDVPLGQALSLSNSLFIACHIIVAGCGIYLFFPQLKEDFAWIKQHFAKYLFAVIVGFIVLLCASILLSSGASQNQDNLNAMQASMGGIKLRLFYLVLTIVGPLNEEFVFRQIFIGKLSEYFPKWVMWFLSGLLFGLLHIPSLAYFNQIWPYFIDGLILGFVYIKTNNNLVASFSIHLLNNLLSLFI